MTSPLLPGDRPTPRSLLPVPALTLVLAAGSVTVAALTGPESARGAVGTTGAVASLLLCLAVTWATHAVLSARALRVRLETANVDVDRLIQGRSRQTEEHRRQHERLTGELTRERARLSAELDQERAHLARSLAAERDRLNEHHDIATTRLAQDHAAERARLTDDHIAERTRLTEQHTAEITRLAEDHTTSLARITDGHAAELRRRDEEHMLHTAALVQKHSDERDLLRAERDRLGEERTRLSRDRDRHIDENARLTVRLREASRARTAALSATANAASRLQALSTGMLADLRAMEERHQDEEVLTDLLHLDHRTAQAGRLADSVAVLTGARSGRRWARPIGMESILRGAMGRINGYRRIRLHSATDIAVAGHAAEGVMHALAELLDNAANFSPPIAEVHVYVETVPAGVIISVEDSGLVMGETQLRRAESAVAGETDGLGGLTGTRLGLTVVGQLARRYGLRVSYRPSARGGTGVLMLVPQEILVTPETPGPSLPRTTPAAARATAATTTADGDPSGGTPSRTASRDTVTPAPSARAKTPDRPTRQSVPAARETPAAETPGPSAANGLPQRHRAHRDNAPAARPADRTTPETDHRTPYDVPGDQGVRDTHGTPRTEPERDATGSPSVPGHPDTASRATAAPGPLPTHQSPGPGTGIATEADADTSEPAAGPTLALPRRRRGRTFDEAERARSASRTVAPPRQTPPTAGETKARATRFNSFRRAVRATPTQDTATDDATATHTPPPPPATHHTDTATTATDVPAADATTTNDRATNDPATAATATAAAPAHDTPVYKAPGTEDAPTGAARHTTPTTPAIPEGDPTS